MKGKLWIMLMTGAMAAGTLWASGAAEWRRETEQPAPLVRHKHVANRSALRKSDRQVAMSVFHAARVPQSGTLKHGSRSR